MAERNGTARLKFPYGISDFHALITEGYFYVDRTDRIRVMEELGPQLLFLRPRRFGKSLWLTTLANYYDVATGDEFERLFGRLAIGRQPTPLRNRYLIMRWDFSMIRSHVDVATIERDLHDHINGAIEQFIARYRPLLQYDIGLDSDNALRSLQSALAAVRQTPYPLYLLIDEYDNFANEVLMAGRPDSRRRYEDLLYGEGAFRTVFKAVKAASAGLGLERVFITGVSPLALSDITSGYNIVKNVTFEPALADLCGFREGEVAEVMERLGRDCGYPPERTAEALAALKTFYNGYMFDAATQELFYNPTLALYYLDHFKRHCQSPREMLDSNLATDRARLQFAGALPGGRQVVRDALNNEPPVVVQRLAERFGVDAMLSASEDPTLSASLLYYLGVLTFGGATATGKLSLRIPNLVVRRLYAEQIQEMLLPSGADRALAQQAAETLFTTGDLQPLCDFVEQRLFAVFANRDYRWANEMTIKTAFLTLLFNDLFYIVDSEAAVGRSHADLPLIIRPEMRRYQLLDLLLEFKYLKPAALGLSGEATRQLGADEVKALPAVQQALAEAETQLRVYRQALEAKYGAILRLRTYAIAALGFDRLAWAEVN
jgi:hypothetical protein